MCSGLRWELLLPKYNYIVLWGNYNLIEGRCKENYSNSLSFNNNNGSEYCLSMDSERSENTSWACTWNKLAQVHMSCPSLLWHWIFQHSLLKVFKGEQPNLFFFTLGILGGQRKTKTTKGHFMFNFKNSLPWEPSRKRGTAPKSLQIPLSILQYQSLVYVHLLSYS